MPGKRSFFISSMAAIISRDTMKAIERGLKSRLYPYQMPPPATTSDEPYLMIFCQVWSFHLTHRNSASLPKAT